MQIRPLEEAYKFGDFFSSYLNESDFHAKPSVLLLGQYSTGTLAQACPIPSSFHFPGAHECSISACDVQGRQHL